MSMLYSSLGTSENTDLFFIYNNVAYITCGLFFINSNENKNKKNINQQITN